MAIRLYKIGLVYKPWLYWVRCSKCDTSVVRLACPSGDVHRNQGFVLCGTFDAFPTSDGPIFYPFPAWPSDGVMLALSHLENFCCRFYRQTARLSALRIAFYAYFVIPQDRGNEVQFRTCGDGWIILCTSAVGTACHVRAKRRSMCHGAQWVGFSWVSSLLSSASKSIWIGPQIHRVLRDTIQKYNSWHP